MRWWTSAVLLLAAAFTLDGVQGQTCENLVDLMIVIDGSAGLTEQEFIRLKALVNNYVRSKQETSSQSTVNAGYVVVSENVDGQLAPTRSYADFSESLNRVAFTAGRSLVTGSAIEVAFSRLLNANSPAGTPKVIIVLASQTSANTVSTQIISNFARQYSMTVWGVGLKNMDQSELLVIAGDQSTLRNLADVANAASLPSIPLNLAGVDCGNVGPVTPPPSTPRPTPSTPRPTPSTPRPTPSTPRPTPSTPRPTPSTPRPTPSTPRPTPSTPRPTPSTPRPTPSTPRPTPSTPRPTPSTPRPTPSTPRPTPSTPRPTPSTQRPTPPPTTRITPTPPTTPRPTTPRPTTPRSTPRPTTPSPTPPPTTRRPTTLRPLETDSLCQDAVIVAGVGVRGHPTDPEKYIQCYFPQTLGGGSRRRRKRQVNIGFSAVSMGTTNTLAVIRQCAFGLFWNQEMLTCSPASTVALDDDACAAAGAPRSRAVSGNCRAYYMCINGRSTPFCCPMGSAYTKFGCLDCPSCTENCMTSAAVTTYACNYLPVWSKPDSYRVFKWSADGGSYVERQCAESCYFNLATCDCAFKPWTETNDTAPAPVCNPSFTIGFSQIVDGGPEVRATLENDNSFADYGGPLVIEFRYREDQEIVSRHALLSSTECPRAGFLLITVDRDSILVEVTTERGVLTSLSLPTVGFKPEDFKTFRLVDNNDFITATVSDGRDGYATRVRAPATPYLQCGLDVGRGKYVEEFQGAIDRFSLYQCIPTNILA